MKNLQVNLKDRSYRITIGQNIISKAGVLLEKFGFGSGPIVITNGTVMRFHGATLLRALDQSFGKIPVIRIGDGERFKNHTTLLEIYRRMFLAKADRRSWVLAFGGGVVGDIAGFAAATFMRGIPFVMMPTTLLSQVDSSIGGKVGINVVEGKNLIGAFYQPAAVLTDIDVLKTLPGRELSAGLFEVIKYGAIRSEALLRYLERRMPEILNCSPKAMEHIVMESSRIKASVVETDEKETGLRMILNYGHTVGHAFEAATSYGRFKHGEAVGWGMIAALGLGLESNLLRKEDTARLIRLIKQAGRLPSLRGISFEALWKALTRDKKFRAGDIRIILLPKLGKAEIFNHVDPLSLRRFLKRFLEKNGSVL